jgi:hypothetical protein
MHKIGGWPLVQRQRDVVWHVFRRPIFGRWDREHRAETLARIWRGENRIGP